VNAFLALDVDVDTDDLDAVTQSIEYARCNNYEYPDTPVRRPQV